ncbi:MAG: HEAT repeat domain-containing protein [Kofleriaceae bacterium]
MLLRLPPPPRADPTVRGASYLATLAQNIQPAWAQYLENCRLMLRRDHPLNAMSLAATAELVIDRTGQLVISELITSNNAEFDRAIRELLAEANRVAAPPSELLSDDDRVHIRWLFARDHRQAGAATASVTAVELPLLMVAERLLGQGELARAATRVASAPSSPDRSVATERVMTAALNEALVAPSTGARRAAVEAAQVANQRGLVPVLITMASTETDRELRGAAIAALGVLGDSSTVAVLEGLLVSELRAGSQLAIVATNALVALGASAVAAAAIGAALAAGPASAREVALECHGIAPTPSIAATLSAWFRRGDARTRASVCSAIAVDAGPVTILLRGLGDADATVRATCAAAASRRTAIDRSTLRRLRELTRDRDYQVRAAAVAAIAKREPVVGAIDDPASEVRRAAVVIASESELRGLAFDADPDVRAAAIARLGVVHPTEAVRAIADPAAQVRRAAVPLVTDPSALERLATDPAPEVATIALTTLVAHRGRLATTPALLRRLAAAPAGSVERVRIARAWLLAPNGP